ncbi:MAG TPA: hypothetical protein PL048_07005 [Leptospiraceae bacterium]|nr:hypothetical protein [Leptospiraceae bacterium]HMY68157.1 hypothetical protein [Leptospiraceae bacterium]HMZ58506.1 hypothetical protein [Leptospiraceae bacterium]HNF13199.1 hypothetical protein [Leptospiraceae bacterium]HNF24606.1 hypothetical protein [Leptospiraceae bacterium]
MIKSVIFLIIFFVISECKETAKGDLKFGAKMEMLPIDTNNDGKKDAIGYYVNNSENHRIVYQEHDADQNGKSEFFVWSGLSAMDTNKPTKDTVKVHEEEDTDKDGKIDTIRWLLPNDFIAMSQVDRDADGYFETTNYYTMRKTIARSEVDTNKDGYPDQFFWTRRVEVDTDFDKKPDKYYVGSSEADIRTKANDKSSLKPLAEKESWVLNPALVPAEEKSIIRTDLN